MRILVGALTALPLIGMSGIEEEAREGLAEVRAEADLEFFNLPRAFVVGADMDTEESFGNAILFVILSSTGLTCSLVTLAKEA